MSDRDTEQPQDLTHSGFITEAGPVTPPSNHAEPMMARGGRRKAPREPRGRPENHWNELQELRAKLAEHEETMAKLKSAFASIALALDVLPGRHDMDATTLGQEFPANRPPRMSRRGGINGFSDSHYKNNNRGGRGGALNGGYRSYRNNAPGFRSTFLYAPS
jgi:hypothetical protein